MKWLYLQVKCKKECWTRINHQASRVSQWSTAVSQWLKISKWLPWLSLVYPYMAKRNGKEKWRQAWMETAIDSSTWSIRLPSFSPFFLFDIRHSSLLIWFLSSFFTFFSPWVISSFLLIPWKTPWESITDIRPSCKPTGILLIASRALILLVGGVRYCFSFEYVNKYVSVGAFLSFAHFIDLLLAKLKIRKRLTCQMPNYRTASSHCGKILKKKKKKKGRKTGGKKKRGKKVECARRILDFIMHSLINCFAVFQQTRMLLFQDLSVFFCRSVVLSVSTVLIVCLRAFLSVCLVFYLSVS